MPKILEDEKFLFVNKPSGISSHRVSPEHLGFVEWCAQEYSLDLRVCHRLDKDTSGLMVFAKTKEAAQILTEKFTGHQVSKEYYFLSDKKSEFENWAVYEEGSKGTLVKECPLEGSIDFEAFTEFIRVPSEGLHYLYKALPRSGKTHQIRKHAVQAGIPIIGDNEYGGAPFPRLMLHAKSLKFSVDDQLYELQSPPSPLFLDFQLREDPILASWIHSFERRKTLWPQKVGSEQALRLFHSETGNLRGDQVGETLVLGWWKTEAPDEADKSRIQKLMKILNIKNWVFQWRPGVEAADSARVVLSSPSHTPEDWVFQEGNCRFVGKHAQGQNFGLFLDQRDRRQWVRENSKGKRVLNLFSFTCGFSLQAALGGAEKVVSVDTASKYLQWGRENFQLNDLDPEAESYEFRAMDSLRYLDWAIKKGLQFDLVICDPPSFSRDKKSKSSFSVAKDFSKLIQASGSLLSPGGDLLFSTNYEKWDLQRWRAEIQAVAENTGFQLVQTSPSQWDYEWQNQGAHLKAFFLKKA